jgi:hypothetical protein
MMPGRGCICPPGGRIVCYPSSSRPHGREGGSFPPGLPVHHEARGTKPQVPIQSGRPGGRKKPRRRLRIWSRPLSAIQAGSGRSHVHKLLVKDPIESTDMPTVCP